MVGVMTVKVGDGDGVVTVKEEVLIKTMVMMMVKEMLVTEVVVV